MCPSGVGLSVSFLCVLLVLGSLFHLNVSVWCWVVCFISMCPSGIGLSVSFLCVRLVLGCLFHLNVSVWCWVVCFI